MPATLNLPSKFSGVNLHFLFIFLFFILPLRAQETHQVKRVVDGDTFVLDSGERVRMIGINTPEEGFYFYTEATDKLKELIDGKTVTLIADPLSSNKDRFGRLLRYVFVNGEDINLKMIESGLAEYYDKFRFSKEKEYAKAELEAVKAKIGLWGEPETKDTFPWGWVVAGVIILGAIIFIFRR